MIKLCRDIHSLTDFKRNTNEGNACGTPTIDRRNP